MRLVQLAALASGAGLAVGAAQAAVITDITVNPLTGSAAIPGDGVRTVVNSNFMLDSFDVGAGGDRFRFLLSAFGIDSGLNFVNTTARQLPPSGAPNRAAGRDRRRHRRPERCEFSEPDRRRTEVDGAGFFIYSNTVLDINRLVFSENLNVPTADLAILAFMNDPKGDDPIADLPGFSNLNFAAFAEPVDVAPVPLAGHGHAADGCDRGPWRAPPPHLNDGRRITRARVGRTPAAPSLLTATTACHLQTEGCLRLSLCAVTVMVSRSASIPVAAALWQE